MSLGQILIQQQPGKDLVHQNPGALSESVERQINLRNLYSESRAPEK